MQQLGQMSNAKAQQIVSFQKEVMLQQGIFLTLGMLGLLGILRLLTLNLAFSSLVIGLGLAAILLFSLSDAKHKYGLLTGDVVNIAMIFAVSLCFI